MYPDILQKQFAQIGANLVIEFIAPPVPQRPRREVPVADYVLDIRQTNKQEQFLLTIREDMEPHLEFMAVDIQPTAQHLLLLSKNLQGTVNKEKFLCGHDERHWFVAPVVGRNPVNVYQAMEALKPDMVLRSQKIQGVRRKDWQKRHNEGFIRQGEWFFVPDFKFRPLSLHMVLHNEPIQRPRSKPHWVEELYRVGGELVYVHPSYPNGLTGNQYRKLLEQKPAISRWSWQILRRNPQVYARGKVRHPDHKTITLPFWHRVMISGEVRNNQVAFFD